MLWRHLATLSAAALVCGDPRLASAEPVLGLEPRLELLVPDDPRPGGGLAFTAGYAVELYPLYVLPEASFSVSAFPGDQTFASFRATGGVRAGITAAVEPSIYVHGGYGLVFAGGMAGGGGGFDGFALDAGVGLDKRVDRGLTLGGTLGYQGLFGSDAMHGMAAAFRVGFWL
jgi:hypothetical protein